MMARLVIIGGHGWKRRGEYDPGALGPAGTEADWTADLARRVVDHLRRMGRDQAEDVNVGANGTRADYADDVDADLVVYLHGDVGEPAAYWYPGSTPGSRAALAALGGLSWSGMPWTLDAHAATEAAVPRAHGLLGSTRAPAILLELVDMRRADHVRWLRDHLDDVARAIARGLVDA